MSIQLPSALMGKELRIIVVGAGGTGSILLGGLAQMAIALHALGHPGLDVLVVDDDRVSPANIGRQAFCVADVGQYKAEVLVNRINLSFGLDWGAVTERLGAEASETRFAGVFHRRGEGQADVWIGCVDTRSARKAIRNHWYHSVHRNDASIWLDCGNTADSGQVIMGLRESVCTVEQTKRDGKWISPEYKTNVLLPSCADLFPEMVDDSLDGADTAPSCSLPEALTKQDLFTNRAMADAALNLLWQFLRHGTLSVHGAFINLKNCRTNPLPVDEAVWQRMGYERPPLAVRAKEQVTEEVA